MAKAQCEICNRVVEAHLQKQKKRLCFSCLTEEVSNGGALPVFNLKQKPVQAPCAVCELEVGGNDLVPSPWGFICRACCDVCETQTGVPWALLKLAAQNEWLIKANTKILGPFTSEEVEARLRDSTVVPHDEVIRPLGRWHLLRDEEAFRLVLNEVRNRAQTKREKSLDNTVSDVLTPTFGDFDAERLLQRDTVVDTIKTDKGKEIPPTRDTQSTRDLMKSYAFRDDAKLAAEYNELKKKKTWAALALLLFAGVFLAVRLNHTVGGTSRDRILAFQELVESGLRAEKVGDYAKALGQYSEARMIKPNDSELLLHLAPIMLFHEHQLLQAQSMFQQILKNETDINYQKTSYVGLGLISLEDHNLDEAKNYFLKARTLDPDYLPSIVNLSVIAFLKDDFTTAGNLMAAALPRSNGDGAIVLTAADISIGLHNYNPKGAKGELLAAAQLIESYLNSSKDYEQEALIEYARINSILGQDARAAEKIERFLDVDPEQTELHVRDWQIYRGRVSWSLLLESLKKVTGSLPSSPRLTAALGLAMYRGREKLEGANNIEQAFSQSQEDPLLMSLVGWVELKLGHRENAEANIKRAALINEKYKLPRIMQARLCATERDWDCAKKEWDAVLRMDQRSSEALHGLALVAWNKRDRALTNNYMSQLYALDGNYIPYLRLVQEIQNADKNGSAP